MNYKSDNKQFKYFEVLHELTKKTKYSNCNYKHAAAIIKNGKILSIGVNSFISGVSLHAEICAIKQCMSIYPKNLLKGLDLIVVRCTKTGELSNSRPCKHCCSFIKEKGVRNIFYSNEFGEIIHELSTDFQTDHVCSSYLNFFSKQITR
jgi:tRNA(Arg) A34 adenosine deaminase TadA